MRPAWYRVEKDLGGPLDTCEIGEMLEIDYLGERCGWSSELRNREALLVEHPWTFNSTPKSC
jgi:hypothetical protein